MLKKEIEAIAPLLAERGLQPSPVTRDLQPAP
jgi:hypothetical protein